jgi:hypothetical protein
MANKNIRQKNIKENIEDYTLYGEFIPSFDQWTTFENQQQNVERLQRITKKNK